MANVGNRGRALCAAFAGLSALAAAGEAAACCPNDGNGSPKAVAKTGLGDAQPAALDLAQDPSWHVYQFARDGITYLQINDLTGNVRAGVGRVDSTAWVMPMGRDVDRVRLVTSAPANGKVVFRSAEVVVFVVQSSSGDEWYVQTPAKTQ
ncbi:hypothetical protein [Xanthomonas sp. 3498]|uniref:hypothetical protein n=1 Tax=Xanthomonas sp. 3498 TaxID=2663863 RepID=UPI00160733C5|nr:hypothetical protein [Xanthomonas sp. 3498]MBB5875860.1 hypothetical protein [Xanthomonas sp. 3498]